MKWTTEKPTKPGWYWINHPKWYEGCGKLDADEEDTYFWFLGMGEPIDSDKWDNCKWAGPIPEPTD